MKGCVEMVTGNILQGMPNLAGLIASAPASSASSASSAPSAPAPLAAADTFESGSGCTEEDREKILFYLHESLDVQAGCRVLGMISLAAGVIGASVCVPAGLALGAGGFFATAKLWQYSNKLLNEAVKLNEKSGCYTPEELNNIYNSIP